ncbi:MAG: tetratricopeptide repeat protein [Planctomycetota bacterium]
MLIAGGVCRAVLLHEYVTNDPFATYLTLDAETYWKWGGRLAEGVVPANEPYFSAPLYPYLLAGLRAAGGGLVAAYVAQTGLHLLTFVLLAWTGRRIFGPAVGLLGGGLFLMLMEPASFALRILPSTLQLAMVCVAWLALIRAAERPTAWRAAIAGGTLGVFALTYASAVLAIPVAALWVWRRRAVRGRSAESGADGATAMKSRFAGLAPALGLAAVAGAMIAPATIHNYRATGELILISAQAGVTFAQGNAADANGTYNGIPGISLDRERQNRDAFRFYERATGEAPSWRAVNRFFYRRGLAYWTAEPLGAARLLAQKAYWFLAARNYGDIYVPTAERAAGLLSMLHLTPIHTAWLLPPALVALCIWLKHRSHFPALLLFCVPLATVLAFWFSPRYRLPAVPVITIAAAWSLAQLWQCRSRRSRTVLLLAGWIAALVLGPVNRAAGFDPPDRWYLHVQLGRAAFERGDLAGALPWFRLAHEEQPDNAETRANLGMALSRLGDPAAALTHLQEAVRLNPLEPVAHNELGRALAALGRPAEALAAFSQAVGLQPDATGFHHDLAVTLANQGRMAEARAEFETALALDPRNALAYLMLGNLLAQQGESAAALQHWRAAWQANPAFTDAPIHVARTLAGRGEVAAALAELRSAHAAQPQDATLTAELTRQLALLAPSAAERQEALVLAQQLVAEHPADPTVLELLATVLAASGRPAEARLALARAIELAETAGAPDYAQTLRLRLNALIAPPSGATTGPAGGR